MTTVIPRFRIFTFRRGVDDPQLDVDKFERFIAEDLVTARSRAVTVALEDPSFDALIEDTFTGNTEIHSATGGRLQQIGSVEIAPERPGPSGGVFGVEEPDMPALIPRGAGPELILQFAEGEQRIRIDELGIISPGEYQEFLKRIQSDVAFTPRDVPTPGVFVSDIRNGIRTRFGSLPDNWDTSLVDQLTRAYFGPFDEFILQTGGFGGRPKGRPRG